MGELDPAAGTFPASALEYHKVACAATEVRQENAKNSRLATELSNGPEACALMVSMRGRARHDHTAERGAQFAGDKPRGLG
ncbi:MAG: hypothetical protein AAGI89_09790 [Pseudomonadota bacterium]